MMHNKKSDAFRLLDYVTDHGADHDEDCPGDDTCNCSFSGRNAAVNRLVKALLDEPAAPPVPLATPTHVEIDHDGDLSIDFDRANDRVVSLTIYQDGRVGYSALVDGKTAHGIVNATEPMPAWVRAAICAPPVPETPQGWQPIETAPEMRKVMVSYVNVLGKRRCVLACYYLANSLEMHDDYAEVGTYDDATGNSYAPEGWYEEHESEHPIMRLEAEPTHWMPMPAAPTVPPQEG